MLLKAIKEIGQTEEYRNRQIVMFIGTGPDLEMLQRYVIDNDMQGQVLFLGLRDDMPTVLSFVDLLVSTSISSHEGMSNVILEAMASGKPVISTESVGSAEIIRDGYNGFLVDSASTQHLCERLLLLQKNRALLKEMGDNARKHVQGNFSLAKMIEGYEMVYEETLLGRSI
jgi:glycosyltransferase involved in cell wall biosynthesis